MDNKEFLEKIGFGESCVDMDLFLQEFQKEMKEGLAEEKTGTALMMLPTYISGEGKIPAGEPVAILDVGGTNLRAAKIVFDENGKAIILDSAYSHMPGHDKHITVKEMLSQFASAVLPMISENGNVVLCFSYAFKYCPGGEGMILEMGKEVYVDDAEGTMLGSGLESALKDLGVKQNIKVKVINDTDAVLLSALTTGAKDVIGFILGTGTNTAYLENCSNIKKISDASTKRMSVNMESGGFGGGPVSSIDRVLDENSVFPGIHRHEKKISGAYLGKIISMVAAVACEEGLGSETLKKSITENESLKMADVSLFLEEKPSALDTMCEGDKDRKLLRDIIVAVERRAGMLSAGNLIAVIRKMRDNGTEGVITIAENGTTFVKCVPLRKACMDTMEKYKDITGEYRFVSLENDTLIGTAAAAFLA